ncbi:hypothetical protein FVF58_50965 [Paraburkholderia panacisoli]|uniref:Uncharacterized protein n=1 Tax=Paraburkholderia panacisoli TaxID=2603818 RepID=A0A5B0FWV5_9BURK|nr:hypothetical protein [Paraburkholderia panacisoli]KAA0995532.1 hypothetical protein FVF58_50965 [Paraburkholderia panacisoli]
MELLNIWFHSNGAEADWLQVVRLGALSEKIALDFAKLPHFADSAWLAKLFTDGWRMDYRSPNVWKIYAACEHELKTS